LERTLARSLLRPLGLMAGELTNPHTEVYWVSQHIELGQPFRGALTDPEIQALWELANSREERLRYRFVEEALRGPETTRQLMYRAEAALNAAVGLHGKRRFRVEQLLVKRLQDPTLTAEQQADVAVAAAVLGGLTPKAARCLRSALAQGLAQPTDLIARLGL